MRPTSFDDTHDPADVGTERVQRCRELQLVAVSFDANDPRVLAAFWAGMLGREIVEEASGALLPRQDTQVGLRFVATATEKTGQNHLHLHLTSSTLEDQRHIVETALGLGGRHLDVGQLPEEDHVVLADPGGNEFCVIGPGNEFLAGCGLLGEVSCDGTREVGLFWRDALGWPLVWDRDEETAVQSPRGGTKVSWGGPPVAPKHQQEPAATRPRCAGPRCGSAATGRPRSDRSRRPGRGRRARRPRRQRVLGQPRLAAHPLPPGLQSPA